MKFFRSTFIFTSLSFLASLFSYGFNFLLAHAVSVSQYGEYSAAISYFSIFSVPFGALSLILMKRIGAVTQKERHAYVLSVERTFYSSIIKQLPVLILLSGVIGGFLLLVSRLQFSSVLFVLALTAFTFFITMYATFFQAQKQFLFAGVLLCILSILKMVGGGIVTAIHAELWELYALFVIIHLIEIIFVRWYLNKGRHPALPSVQFPNFVKLIKKPAFYLPVVTFLGLAAIVNIDIMIVKRFFDAADAGSYAAISLLGRIILYVSLPLTTVAFSFFTDKDTEHQSDKVLWISIGVLSVIGLISVIGYAVLPSLVVDVVFGEKYIGIASLVWLAALFGSVYALATLLGQYWVSQHHPIAMCSVIVAIIQGFWLTFMHDSFTTVLYISIASCTALLLIYLSALIYRQRQSYARA